VRLRIGLVIACVVSSACGDPDQLFRHRDAGAPPPPPVTGAGAAGGGVAGSGLGGASALAGTTGAAGTTGIAGTSGAAGTTGIAGTNGAAGGHGGGTAGSSAAGAAGTSGAAGSSGAAGTTAAAGSSGAGTSGAAGLGGADASADAATPCTSTPDCHCDSYGGHAYKFCGAGRGYVAAASDCAAQGMRLIRIDDEAENQWAFAGKGARGFPGVWIGADDLATEGDWRWSDGTPFWMGKAGAAGAGPVNGLFNAWQTSPAQPDQNGAEDCAGYDYANDRWADLPCTNHNAYICEAY
jgi:hypothetical protein